MKERPILFSGPMVRALLDGRKTQTRRIIKPQPRPFVQHTPDRHPTNRTEPYIDAYCGEKKTCANPRGMSRDWHWWTADNRPDPTPVARCRYGAPGERLWVRERTRVFDFPGRNNLDVIYEADGARAVVPWPDRIKEPERGGCLSMGCYREASRITLEITSVRVERLQEISEDDARAEGCAPAWLDVTGVRVNHGAQPTYRQGYARLWTDINGPGSWSANPWVWVVAFKVIEPNTPIRRTPDNTGLGGTPGEADGGGE